MIFNEISYGKIDLKSLTLNIDDIYFSMGKGFIPDKRTERDLLGIIDSVTTICSPEYMIVPCDGICHDNVLSVNGIDFNPGRIISPFIYGADKYMFFVATAGAEFQELQDEYNNLNDIYREYLLDAVGSELAEAVVRYLCETIKCTAESCGWGTSFPYSPGYCGWKVGEQQKLFRLFPEYPCGIRLTESSLMYPIKSVSGIVATGLNIKPQKYGCELCRKKDCYKNRFNR